MLGLMNPLAQRCELAFRDHPLSSRSPSRHSDRDVGHRVGCRNTQHLRRLATDSWTCFHPFRTSPLANFDSSRWFYNLPLGGCFVHLPRHMRSLAPSWTCHRLLVGRSAWHRRDAVAVGRVRRLCDLRGRLLGVDGSLAIFFSEERLAVGIGALVHSVLAARPSGGTCRNWSEDPARGMRIRFHHRLASWSTRRRVVQSMAVVPDIAQKVDSGDIMLEHAASQLVSLV